MAMANLIKRIALSNSGRTGEASLANEFSPKYCTSAFDSPILYETNVAGAYIELGDKDTAAGGSKVFDARQPSAKIAGAVSGVCVSQLKGTVITGVEEVIESSEPGMMYFV